MANRKLVGVAGLVILLIVVWAAGKSSSPAASTKLLPSYGAVAQMPGGAKYAQPFEKQSVAGGQALIVLSTGGDKWNTGVWSGWGESSPTTLRWAAGGTVVTKTCPYKCQITHDGQLEKDADLVVMELINHPKFLGHDTKIPIPWPEQKNGRPALALMYNEPPQNYPYYTTDPEVLGHFDMTMTTGQGSTLPITTVCNWGRPVDDFLAPPPKKEAGRNIVYFLDHGLTQGPYTSYLTNLMRILEADKLLDSFRHMANKPTPPDAPGGDIFNIPWRVTFMGTYKFALVTEVEILKDWVSLDWSQALVSGALPIYIGAPNIEDFAPHPNSFVDIRKFKEPNQLVDHLKYLMKNETAYLEYFAWKKHGMSQSFLTALDRCVYYAECRICEATYRMFRSKAPA